MPTSAHSNDTLTSRDAEELWHELDGWFGRAQRLHRLADIASDQERAPAAVWAAADAFTAMADAAFEHHVAAGVELGNRGLAPPADSGISDEEAAARWPRWALAYRRQLASLEPENSVADLRAFLQHSGLGPLLGVDLRHSPAEGPNDEGCLVLVPLTATASKSQSPATGC